ncbi:RecQ family ATP-dependent DNA helicase [Sediminitomix flava]|uniref:DNA 3'-5' helicase n=1 Tax=Sediminitomix flava TaxID=379075 RepID=A0A315ZDZ3_SEDFL|nr:RecQ family ATP-dependent DNA helicase [Sediminitomix flava]PWJ43373.1 RecQ-like ATP-dependent DNA helicase [Sediminitomix flava]
MKAQELLKKHFGFDQFRNGQENVVSQLISGQSAAAIFPTGSGKSLCYQLPALALPHLTLVVSPLLALIKDQLNFLEAKGIPSARLDSSLSKEEMFSVQDRVRNGAVKILFISVERFKNERFRHFLSTINISMLVVDEAHCISEWGHNFRPDYLKLAEYRKEFNIPQVCLLTATATPKVVKDMCSKFELPKKNVTITGFYRENLSLHSLPVKTDEKDKVLINMLSERKQECNIVYVTLQQTAEKVAETLNHANLSAEAYHAGMSNESRIDIQNRFMRGETKTIVATIAFGMGIDKSDIRNVFHYDLPKSIENYSQEIGRAGRDGSPSNCYVLGNLDDIHTLENFVYGDTPLRTSIEKVLREIKEAGDSWEYRIYQLSNDSNIKQLPLKTLLVYLEMFGIIKPQYSYFADYRLKFNLTKDEIIAKFEGERKEFIKAIFKYAPLKKVWASLNFNELLTNYNTDRDRVLKALEYFQEKEWLVVETKYQTEVVKVLNPDFDVEEILEKCDHLFQVKEEGEVKRIDILIRLLSTQPCIAKSLSIYFGEETDWEKCGHCSSCKNGVQALKHSEEQPSVRTFAFYDLTSEFIQKFDQMPSPQIIARFLCGIQMPLFTKMKVKKMYGFGALANYRFREVLEWVEGLLSQTETPNT